MKISVLIPAYNEAENLKNNLPKIAGALRQYDYEIIVNDNNSKDGTERAIRELQKSNEKIILMQRKTGNTYGHGIKEAFEKSKGTHVIILDADGSHNPKHVRRIARKLKKNDLVLASRFVENGMFDQGIIRKLFTKPLNAVLKRILRLRIKDLTNGYVGVKKEKILQAIEWCEKNNTKFFTTMYVVILCHIANKKNWVVKEIPTNYANRTIGYSKIPSVQTGMRYLTEAIKLRLSARKQ